MRGQFAITEEEMQDQRERMVEEWGLSQEEAEEVFKNVKTRVMLTAQDLDKDWNDDVVNAVSNLLIGIQHQQYQNSRQNKRYFYDRLFRFMTSSLQAITLLVGTYLSVVGYHILGGILLIISFVFVLQHLWR